MHKAKLKCIYKPSRRRESKSKRGMRIVEGVRACPSVVTQHVSKHNATLLMTIFINMDYLAANALIRICLLSLFPVCTCLIYYNNSNSKSNNNSNSVSCFLICHTLKANTTEAARVLWLKHRRKL